MAGSLHRSEVVCPFCALACDDLEVEASGRELRVTARGCARAEAAFARPAPEPSPAVDGRPCSLDQALDAACAILAASRLPLLAVAGTDTAGMRAAMALAEATGGIVDHAAGPGLFTNLLAMQSTGWFTSSLAEARTRPDLVLLVGSDGAAAAPRLHERVLRPAKGGPRARRLVQLGGARPAAGDIEHLPCPAERLLETVGALRARLAGRKLPPAALALLPEGTLEALAHALEQADYALVVWAAADLPAPHGELLTEHLAELVKGLNARGRAAGLPLAGPGNVIGCNQVCAWQSGFPLRTGFAGGVPEHRPQGYGTLPLLERGTVDALLWISAFEPAAAPVPTLPSIALPSIHMGMALDDPPPAGVFLPAGTPGLDHAGSIYRTDGVVALPVRALRPSALPTAASLLDALRARLSSPPRSSGQTR